MADLSPNGTNWASGDSPRADPNAALEKARRDIEALEESLRKHRELVLSMFQTLHVIYHSAPRTWGQRLAGMYNRLLPPQTYRRAVCRPFLRGVKKLSRIVPKKEKKIELRSINEGYARWMETHEPGPAELDKQRQTRFEGAPRISILVSVHRPFPSHLEAMLLSVAEQTYGNWELCLAEDNPECRNLRHRLQEVSRADTRVRVISLPAGQGMAACHNAALRAATGEYVGILDQDDTLAPFALHEILQAIHAQPGADFFYSDEDCLTRARARRKHPHFKPDWSPDTLRSHNYIGHLTIFQRRLLEQVGGFRPGYEGEWNYDLILRAVEQAPQIVHIPKILYHRRKRSRLVLPRGEADGPRQALAEHLARSGTGGEVQEGLKPHTYQARYPLACQPLVSIIIPNRDHADVLSRCLASLGKSSYTRYEILIVENQSEQPGTFALYETLARQPNARILPWNKPFNYGALNNEAARKAAGEILLFLNNDVEVINPDWLERLLEHTLRPEVGAVGAKLYYPNDTIQHAGILVNFNHGAGHHQRYFARAAEGYARRLVTVQNLSGVTGACLMIRKEVFEQIQGFDERFVVTYNDVDLCLKIQQQGYRIIWTPFAELYHHECTTRGHDVTPEKRARLQYEMYLLHWKWPRQFQECDAFYNPNLTLEREDCSLGN